MNRPVVTLLAASVLLLPVLSAMGHTDTQLVATLDEQEITVTGHAERDAALHIEAAAGIVLLECPQCVLDKRQSGADEQAKPSLGVGSAGGRAPSGSPANRSLELSGSGPPRAPPLV